MTKRITDALARRIMLPMLTGGNMYRVGYMGHRVRGAQRALTWLCTHRPIVASLAIARVERLEGESIEWPSVLTDQLSFGESIGRDLGDDDAACP